MRTAASLKSQSAKAANRGPKHFRNSSAAAASGASVLRESLKRTITDFDIVNALAEPNLIDVSEVVEQQKLSRFLIGLVAVSWIITFFDGFDSNLISFAAPYFATAYHLSRVQLGNIFSAGLFGTMVGGFALGYFGDRLGRRPTVIFATVAFGILTMCFALANSYWSLLSLRFIDG